MADFAQGLAEDQRRYAITLIGGDTTRSDGALMLSATLIGEVDKDRIIRRSGARPGDEIYVTGTIGDAALGLALAQARIAAADPTTEAFLVNRFRRPEPRVEIGIGLAGLASAAADVSDGLVADLNHICRASRRSAEIELERVPLSEAATRMVTDDQQLRLSLLAGGDDYELVFTAPADVSEQIERLAAQHAVRLTKIGRITDRDRQPHAVTVRDTNGRTVEVGDGGYRHFRR